MNKLSYSIDEFSALTGIGRTLVYAEIKAGRLRRLKVGKRTIIAHDEAERWLAELATKSTEPTER